MVFRLASLSTDLAVGGIEAVLAKNAFQAADFALDERRLTKECIKTANGTFHLAGEGFDFDLSSVRDSSLDFLEITFTQPSAVPIYDWIEQFVENPNFVMAWLVDADYDHWQNAYDPLQFSSQGRSFEHLPMRSNQLPFPLEQTIIDTSSNPGRRVLREGYIEAVGSVMWLGKLFWSLTNAKKNDLTKILWLRISDLPSGVLQIEASDEPFVTASGHSGDVQRELRSVLFPNSTAYSPQS